MPEERRMQKNISPFEIEFEPIWCADHHPMSFPESQGSVLSVKHLAYLAFGVSWDLFRCQSLAVDSWTTWVYVITSTERSAHVPLVVNFMQNILWGIDSGSIFVTELAATLI